MESVLSLLSFYVPDVTGCVPYFLCATRLNQPLHTVFFFAVQHFDKNLFPPDKEAVDGIDPIRLGNGLDQADHRLGDRQPRNENGNTTWRGWRRSPWKRRRSPPSWSGAGRS